MQKCSLTNPDIYVSSIPQWGIDKFGLVDVQPIYPVKTGEPVEDITLIPMGAARLRISAFPVIKSYKIKTL